MHLPALSLQMNLFAALVLNGYSTKVSHYEKKISPITEGCYILKYGFIRIY